MKDGTARGGNVSETQQENDMSKQEWEALEAIVTALAWVVTNAGHGELKRAAVGKAIDAVNLVKPVETQPEQGQP